MNTRPLHILVTLAATLLLAPLALPPVLADAGSTTYAEALLGVLPVAGLGYVAGLAALLRTA